MERMDYADALRAVQPHLVPHNFSHQRVQLSRLGLMELRLRKPCRLVVNLSRATVPKAKGACSVAQGVGLSKK